MYLPVDTVVLVANIVDVEDITKINDWKIVNKTRQDKTGMCTIHVWHLNLKKQHSKLDKTSSVFL